AADDKAKTTQRGKKMKACNKQAADKSLKGDDRKKFMSACLKGSAKS
ncbi:MAG TPA: PsiF family protein, partial [Burkholderiaceae bacterium]|nr:PsiF family protein [Burkholderiaceae bacterium]